MLKIRLKRVGRKHDPSFRVVLIDSHKGPKSGKINEVLGFYDPRKDIKELKGDEIKSWISKGAQVSDTVHNLLVGAKIIEGKKINILPRKSPVVKEKVEEAPTEAETTEDKEEAAKETPKEEPAEETKEEKTDEEPKEEVKEEVKPEEKVPETPALTETKEGEETEPEASKEESDGEGA